MPDKIPIRWLKWRLARAEVRLRDARAAITAAKTADAEAIKTLQHMREVERRGWYSKSVLVQGWHDYALIRSQADKSLTRATAAMERALTRHDKLEAKLIHALAQATQTLNPSHEAIMYTGPVTDEQRAAHRKDMGLDLPDHRTRLQRVTAPIRAMRRPGSWLVRRIPAWSLAGWATLELFTGSTTQAIAQHPHFGGTVSELRAFALIVLALLLWIEERIDLDWRVLYRKPWRAYRQQLDEVVREDVKRAAQAGDLSIKE
jgi:hypothetical protein